MLSPILGDIKHNFVLFYGFETWTHLRTDEASNTFDNFNGFAHNQCAQLSVRHAHTWWHHLPLACLMTPARPLFMQPQLDSSPKQMQIWNQRFGANSGQLSVRSVTSEDASQLIVRKQTSSPCHSKDPVLPNDALATIVTLALNWNGLERKTHGVLLSNCCYPNALERPQNHFQYLPAEFRLSTCGTCKTLSVSQQPVFRLYLPKKSTLGKKYTVINFLPLHLPE